MHGAASPMARNIRRQGVKATKPAEYIRSVFDGPTAERILKAQGHFHIGDDKQGTRVYQFTDAPLERLYARLVKSAKARGDEDRLKREYTALQKYRHHWFSAGLEPSLSSVDLNRVFASDPSSMAGMAKTDRQANHREQYRRARDRIGHRPGIVLDNVVCAELSLEVAGYSVGCGTYKKGVKTYSSPFRAREAAIKLLRGAGADLASLWGIS